MTDKDSSEQDLDQPQRQRQPPTLGEPMRLGPYSSGRFMSGKYAVGEPVTNNPNVDVIVKIPAPPHVKSGPAPEPITQSFDAIATSIHWVIPEGAKEAVL